MTAGAPRRPTIAVVGLGAIGGVVAGTLAALERHDVTVCIRSPIERLVVERPQGLVEVQPRVLTRPEEAAPVDWVLLVTKVHQTGSVAPWLARLCGSGTRIAAMQNGIGHEAHLAPLVGPATVVPTIVYYNGERLAPDRVRIRPAGAYELAVRDDAGGRAFAELLDGSPMRILRSADFATLAWRKLLLNAVANPVTALTQQRQAVFRRPDIQVLCRSILGEAVAVGLADGAQLAPDEVERIMAALLSYPPEAGTSMYFDRLAGRALEVDALTGAVVACGERHGVPTPVNTALLTLLRAVSDAATG
nr:2-dehydropantoate 2-reductase [uncultured Roseococcus sp.]